MPGWFFAVTVLLLTSTGAVSAARDARSSLAVRDYDSALWPSAALLILGFLSLQNALLVVREAATHL